MDKPEFVEDMGRTDDHYFEGILYDNSKCIYCQQAIYETYKFEWVDGSLHSAECDKNHGPENIHVARYLDIHPDRRKFYASHWLEGNMR